MHTGKIILCNAEWNEVCIEHDARRYIFARRIQYRHQPAICDSRSYFPSLCFPHRRCVCYSLMCVHAAHCDRHDAHTHRRAAITAMMRKGKKKRIIWPAIVCMHLTIGAYQYAGAIAVAICTALCARESTERFQKYLLQESKFAFHFMWKMFLWYRNNQFNVAW